MPRLRKLHPRLQVLVIAGALFLFTFSMGALIFGENSFSSQQALMEQVRGSVKADMLYVHPSTVGHH